MSEAQEIRVGVLGCGTVGTSFCQLVAEQASVIEARTGVRLRIVSVSVRDAGKPRAGVDPALLTTDSEALVVNPDIDLVVETMGGVDGTCELVLAALQAGKPVVTANKALLAAHGPELYATADHAEVDIEFEAAVAAGIPLIRPLRESLVGEDISRIMGILNGTTNYILSQMTEHGADYDEALADAQALGYAEADPTADVGGHDAAAKASILATLAFGHSVLGDDVHTEGISEITAEDIADADRRGFVIKLLGVVDQFDDGSIGARVFPAMVPKLHPLAAVRDSFNAVFVEGSGIDQVMLYGRGAGGHPTAAMVLGDTVNAAMNLVAKTHRRVVNLGPAPVRSIDNIESAFFVSLEAADEPGVLAAIANEFGQHDVSISSMEQEDLESSARLLFITHEAVESNFRATLASLEKLPAVKSVGRVLRVIGS